MKRIARKTIYIVSALIVAVLLLGLILAFLPDESKTNHVGVSPEEASLIRQHLVGAHHQFTTTDGETLFLRKWSPASAEPDKWNIAILIFHGFTAHSGAYDMAGQPFSAAGYTTFGLDYRGHGVSGGNRGDNPGKDRWIADLAESVKELRRLGYTRVIVLGHSLGVAAAMCAANAVPDEIAGLILLSGAYEGRKGVSQPPSFFQKAKILASSVFRPNHQAVEYYREGMLIPKDSLFNFRYTLRFVTMLDVKTLRLSEKVNVPVLVGVGDQDELFEIEKVKEFYNLIPGSRKEFLVMKNTTHAKIPFESWQQVIAWVDRTYNSAQ